MDYVTKGKTNRIKVSIDGFSEDTTYTLRFTRKNNCKITNVKLKGTDCGSYTEFYIKEGCLEGVDDIDMELGWYELHILEDEIVVYCDDSIKVQLGDGDEVDESSSC